MILGVYNLATLVTYMGLISSFFSMYFALNNKIDVSLILLILAGCFDLYDGVVARKFNKKEEEFKFGVQIDSIIDVISFGITPIVIGVSLGMKERIDICLFLLYLFATTMRLAYFNMSVINKENNKPVKYYLGLPVTYSSIVIPIITLIIFIFLNKNLLILKLAFLILAILYLLKIHIPKPTGKWYFIFPVIAVLVTILILFFV